MAASGIREGCTEKLHKHRPVALRLPGLQSRRPGKAQPSPGKKPIIRGFYGVNC